LSVAEKDAFKKLARKQNVSFATLVRRVMADHLGKTESFEFKTAPAK
jgi:hypothetical protein